MKRVTIERPDWSMDFIEGLQSEVAAIDDSSTQWTLALIFNLLADGIIGACSISNFMSWSQ